MRTRLLLSFAIIPILLSVITSYASGTKFVRGTAILNDYLIDGTPVKVEVRTTKPSSQYPYKYGFRWGGDETHIPKNVITAIDVWIGNEKILVPLSAFADLAAPNEILLEKAGKGFKLIINGGDAAVSYRAELVFDNENIQRRKVVHGEFPDEVWEETQYSFIRKTDKM